MTDSGAATLIPDSAKVRSFSLKKFIELLRSTGGLSTDGISLYETLLNALRHVDVPADRQFAEVFTKRLRIVFREAGALSDLDRLVSLGVREEVLFITMFFVISAPGIQEFLARHLGDSRERRKKAKILKEAAEVLDGMGPETMTPVWLNLSDKAQLPMPKRTADALHLYANVLFWHEELFDALDANSVLEIAKVTLASAVHRITGKYHDREVSGALGAFLWNPDYDETAHRVWRIRTFPRLEKNISVLPTFLHAVNTVLQECAS